MEWTTAQAQQFRTIFIEARARLRYTVTEVVQASGVSRDVVYAIERGPYSGMRFVDIARLAKLYRLDLNSLATTLGIPTDSLVAHRVGQWAAQFQLLSYSNQSRMFDMLDVLMRGLLATQEL